MRNGWVFLFPFGVLLYTLMIGNWEAGKAGMLAVGVTLLVGYLQKATRPSWREVMDAVEGTGRTMLDLIAITALAGIVIGAFQLSGLTSKLPIVLTSAAGGNASSSSSSPRWSPSFSACRCPPRWSTSRSRC